MSAAEVMFLPQTLFCGEADETESEAETLGSVDRRSMVFMLGVGEIKVVSAPT